MLNVEGRDWTHLVVAEGLLDLLARREEADVEERGDADAGDGVPPELLDELEGQEEEVEPDGAVRKCVNTSSCEERNGELRTA